MMQKFRFLSLLILVLSIPILSNAQTDSIVNVNRVKYQQLRNKLDEYEMVKSAFTVETGENVQGTAYYLGDDLKIIETIYLSETGHRQIEYYFEKGKLFFSLERIQPAEEAVSINKAAAKNNKPATLIENRFYFFDDKLIRFYDTERNVMNLNDPKNSATGLTFIATAYKMKEKLQK